MQLDPYVYITCISLGLQNLDWGETQKKIFIGYILRKSIPYYE